MPASLDLIVAATRQRLSLSRRNSDMRALERAAAGHTPRGFRNQLRRVSQDGIAVIAELKKASPSRGLIRADFRPSELCLLYTSDAADDLRCVDLGGRRIIKKMSAPVMFSRVRSVRPPRTQSRRPGPA